MLEQLGRFGRRYFAKGRKKRMRGWLKRYASRWRRRKNRQELDADWTRRGWKGSW